MNINTDGFTPEQIDELMAMVARMRKSRVTDREQRIVSDRNGFRSLNERMVELDRRWNEFRENRLPLPMVVQLDGRTIVEGIATISFNVVPTWCDDAVETLEKGGEPKYYPWMEQATDAAEGHFITTMPVPDDFDVAERRQAFNALVADLKTWVADVKAHSFVVQDFFAETAAQFG